MLTNTSISLLIAASLLFRSDAQAHALKRTRVRDNIPKQVDVVIVGAGWAGLGAAGYLEKNNKDLTFVVLESNDYIGGRSKTEYFSDGTPIDLGSHKISYHEYDFITTTDGVVTNIDEDVFDSEGGALYTELQIVKNMCSGSDITSFKTGDDTGLDAYALWDVYKDKRKLLGRNKVNKLQKKVWLDGYIEYEKKMTENLTPDSDISVHEVYKSYMATKEMSKLEKRFLQMMIRSEIQGTYGGSLKDTSAITSASNKGILSEPYEYDYGNGTMISYDYDNVEYMQGNFGAFATAYANCQKASGNIAKNIYLQSTVTEIKYDQDGATIKYKTKAGLQEEIKSRFVIVTVSLGVLKSGSIMFTPPLPDWKQDVINKAGFGVLDKWIGYWHEGVETPWSDLNFQWASLATKKKDIDSKYNLFYNGYPVHNKKNILIGYMSGDKAAKMELNSDDEMKRNAMNTLKKMFPKKSVPEPTEFKVSRWATNPNFKGSYYLTKPRANVTEEAEVLGLPLDDTLFFAGEACNAAWWGLTQGAFLSGQQVGTSIIGML